MSARGCDQITGKHRGLCPSLCGYLALSKGCKITSLLLCDCTSRKAAPSQPDTRHWCPVLSGQASWALLSSLLYIRGTANLGGVASSCQDTPTVKQQGRGPDLNPMSSARHNTNPTKLVSSLLPSPGEGPDPGTPRPNHVH